MLGIHCFPRWYNYSQVTSWKYPCFPTCNPKSYAGVTCWEYIVFQCGISCDIVFQGGILKDMPGKHFPRWYFQVPCWECNILLLFVQCYVILWKVHVIHTRDSQLLNSASCYMMSAPGLWTDYNLQGHWTYKEIRLRTGEDGGNVSSYFRQEAASARKTKKFSRQPCSTWPGGSVGNL